MSGATHWLVVPSHRLALCRVEKVANTVLCDLFCSLNKQHSADASPSRRLISGWADFERGCSWESALAMDGQRWSKKQLAAALAEDGGYIKAIFHREPLERFLSAFLSKCTANHDGDWSLDHICKPVFGRRSPSFAQAAQVVGRAGFVMRRPTES